MIYHKVDDASRAVQAMQLPDLWDIEGRTSLSFWLQSIIGRRQFKWTGRDITFAVTRWKPGDWIVAEVDTNTGDMIFAAWEGAEFGEAFTRVG